MSEPEHDVIVISDDDDDDDVIVVSSSDKVSSASLPVNEEPSTDKRSHLQSSEASEPTKSAQGGKIEPPKSRLVDLTERSDPTLNQTEASGVEVTETYYSGGTHGDSNDQ